MKVYPDANVFTVRETTFRSTREQVDHERRQRSTRSECDDQCRVVSTANRGKGRVMIGETSSGTSSTIELGEQRIAIRRWQGNGPRLLLIHGIGSAGSTWNPVIADLVPEFAPITIDLRGHGHSSKPERGYLYGDYIQDLDGVLDALGMRHPLIVGHSLGGIVALWWAASHPDRAAALVVEDTPLRSGLSFIPAFDTWLKLNTMEPDALRTHYATEHPGWSRELVDERAAQMTTTARNVFAELRADSLAHHGVDRIAEIEEIISPTVLIHGDLEAGGMVVPGDAVALVRRLPKAKAIRIPDGGHTLHREWRKEFLAAARPFLREHAHRSDG